MKIDLYTATGTKKGQVSLNETIFGAKVNEDLMHRAVLLRLANRRTPVAHTKTRGEVAYSTRKMFRQKGTGNARRGARSTNLIRGGGVTHGPRNNANYSKAMNKKERRAALFSSLSAHTKSNNILALESFSGDKPKTKTAAELLTKLPEGKNYLFVVPSTHEVFQKSVANLPNVKTITAPYLNPYDVLQADKVCFFSEALPVLEQTFLADKK